MALPKNTSPTFNLTLPSTGEKVRFRPFVVKEEKALLIAQQSEEMGTMVDTLKSVIDSCTFSALPINDLPTFDLEYLFLQIRGKSVGETVDLLFQCEEEHGDNDEKAKVKHTVHLTEIEVFKPTGHDKKIHLFGDVGVVMKYPSLEMATVIANADENIENVFEVVAQSMDFIYQGDEDIFYAHETPKEELMEFLNNLTAEQFEKIQNFFLTMPKLKYEFEFDCPVCGKHNKRVLEGIQNFF